jgi:hypothetical protein
MNAKNLFLIFLLPLSFLEFGCATYGLITATPIENQKTIFKDGNKSVLSMKKNIVIVTPLDEKFSSEQRGDFLIQVKNGSNQDFVFSTDNISAKSTDPKSDGEIALKIFSYEDLVKEEQDRQAWATVAAAIQGVSDSMQASNAGYSNTYGTYNGTNGYGSYSSSTYNYAEAQTAQRQAEADSDARFARIEAEGQTNIRELSSTILKKETIFPDSWYGGIVKIKLPTVTESLGKLTITIVVGNETHVFNFTYSKISPN